MTKTISGGSSLQDPIKAIKEFKCPKWNELPLQPIFNSELVTYLNDLLEPIMYDVQPITPTMIQNYSKWGILPKISGRKYGRTQVAVLIAIVVYKQVLNIDDVKKGIDLQIELESLSESYDTLATALEQAIERIFKSIGEDETYNISKISFPQQTEGVNVVATAFALKLLAKLIIDGEGYKTLGES